MRQGAELHSAPVEDLNGFVVENGRGEEVQGHVRTSPRAVDRKETQACRGDGIEGAVGVSQKLVAAFGGGIEADRMIGSAVRGIGKRCVQAVDRGRRRVDEVLHRMLPAAFEEIGESDEV